jgi:hypothetical protein
MSFRSILVTVWFLTMIVAARADLLWGVNGHPIVSYPGIPIERQLDYLEDLGMKSYRVNISHAKEAPKLVSLVKKAKARGIDILPVITPGNIDLQNDSTEQLYDKARALAVALGSPLKEDVRVWELGNEMENFAIIKSCEKRDNGSQYPCEWGDAGGLHALDYYGPRWAKVSAVLKGLSDGMMSVDPKIRKAMGTAGWGHVGAFERMKKDGIEWDISVWHMYGEDPEWAFKILAQYGRPIWVTEFNNPYGSKKDEQQQAEGLRSQMTRLRELEKSYNVEAAHIYELLDETYWAPNFEAFMGLVRLVPKADDGWRTGEPKPAYFAVREAIRGMKPVPPMPNRTCEPAEIGMAETEPLRQADFAHCLILGRKGDSETLAQWAARLESGELSANGVIMALMRSDEFRRLYAVHGVTDRAYVKFLYRLLLNREADGHGLESYIRQLAKGSITRENVALGMITSSEFRHRYYREAG